jgi:2-oxoglutarate dehydrogenase E2 component (dihydrolipoamide succinyltransferase)
MILEVKVPASGESITSANIARWHKQNAALVRRGDLLVTLETDKVSNELTADSDGTLSITVAEGEEVPIGCVIATITVGTAPEATASPTPPDPHSPQTTPTPQAIPPAFAPPAKDPAVNTPAPDDGRTTRRKMSMLRRKIATHLVSAQQTAAILTTFNEVDMSAVMELRSSVQDGFIQKHGVKLGFMSFFIKAVTLALKDNPSINARIEGNDIVENHFYDIGVAIGTDKGLVVPVLRDVDKKSFAEIERDILTYAGKAKSGTMTLEDLQGGVFSISNGGTYGSLLSTPILNPPQSGILGMHTIQARPIALNGLVVIRPMMYLALSYDHRLVDGKQAVIFLIRIKELLEAPALLMIET